MQKWRILAVDDDPDICDVISATLSDNYEVFTMNSGRQMLEYLEIIEPDFIILDVKMPDIDGYDLCHRIHQNSLFRKIPILFLSALSSPEDQKKGYAEGAGLYLTKPFDPIRLLKNIEVFAERNPPVYLRKRHAIEELAALVVPRGLEPVLPGMTESLPSAEKTPPAPSAAPPKPVAPAAAGAQGESASWRLDMAEKQPAPPTAPPAAPPQPEPRPAREPKPAPAQKGAPAGGALRPRVLFILNDSDELAALAEACEKEFEYVWATDGMSALNHLKEFEPDAIVAETDLPYMDGFNVTREVRANDSFRNVPIIIYSSKAGPNDRLTAQRAGANVFIRRPADPSRIIAALHELMTYQDVLVRPKAKSLQEVLDLIEFGLLHAPDDAI
ncbi:MAG: response regulator [Candidatus Sumerlaeota bacterium]|nr:response regulator [Candidatus Sumerlaeota bacterium]